MDIDELNLGDDDVVVVHADQLKGMHLYVNLRKNMGDLLARVSLAQWVNQGVQIEYLRASGGGWKKGKVRLSLEFTPEKSELEDDPDSLDSIRAKLNDQ